MLKLSVTVEYRSKDTDHQMVEDISEAALNDRSLFLKNPSYLAQFLLLHDNMDIQVVPVSLEESDESDDIEIPCTD